MIASVLAEVNRDRKKRPEPFGPWDFFSSVKRPPRRVMSAEELDAKVSELHAMFGGELHG